MPKRNIDATIGIHFVPVAIVANTGETEMAQFSSLVTRLVDLALQLTSRGAHGEITAKAGPDEDVGALPNQPATSPKSKQDAVVKR